MEQICGNCKFVMKTELTKDLKREYFCRRYPPTPIPLSNGPQGLQTIGTFVPVAETTTCGEWLPEVAN